MLELRKINYEDWKEEYKAIKNIPAYEIGFKNKVISKLLANYEDKEPENGYVPNAYFFL